ncbi:MAG: hypothetical protein KJ626_13930 [Verrucomicrobia bacterium]|nr:hypothetical protein [Verrucomicrobiota bacterium]
MFIKSPLRPGFRLQGSGFGIVSRVSSVVLVALCLFAFVATSHAAPQISWGTDGQYLREKDGATLIIGDRDTTNGFANGGFCQLLYVGSDGYDGFSAGGDGTRGNDVVVDVSWMGHGASMDTMQDGFVIDDFFNNSYPAGSKFALRFFEEPSANWTDDVDSEIPDAPGSFYGVIEGFTSTIEPEENGIEDFAVTTFHDADFLLLARSFIDNAVSVSTNQVQIIIGQLTDTATNTVERSFHLITGVWETVHGFISSSIDTNWTDTITNEWDKVYYRVRSDDPNL